MCPAFAILELGSRRVCAQLKLKIREIDRPAPNFFSSEFATSTPRQTLKLSPLRSFRYFPVRGAILSTSRHFHHHHPCLGGTRYPLGRDFVYKKKDNVSYAAYPPPKAVRKDPVETKPNIPEKSKRSWKERIGSAQLRARAALANDDPTWDKRLNNYSGWSTFIKTRWRNNEPLEKEWEAEDWQKYRRGIYSLKESQRTIVEAWRKGETVEDHDQDDNRPPGGWSREKILFLKAWKRGEDPEEAMRSDIPPWKLREKQQDEGNERYQKVEEDFGESEYHDNFHKFHHILPQGSKSRREFIQNAEYRTAREPRRNGAQRVDDRSGAQRAKLQTAQNETDNRDFREERRRLNRSWNERLDIKRAQEQKQRKANTELHNTATITSQTQNSITEQAVVPELTRNTQYDEKLKQSLIRKREEVERSPIKMGTERIIPLLNKLDNPQSHLKVVHVAGTNGKGSVVAYLANTLSGCGYKVGHFSSPHLIDRWDGIQINGKPISAGHFSSLETKVNKVATENNIEASPFERLTACAILYFFRENVDIAIIECGMGGRLDATNVFKTPLVSVITSISKDHLEYLGDDEVEIASHKAGIIKPNCPVVAALNNRKEVNRIITDAAHEAGSLLYPVEMYDTNDEIQNVSFSTSTGTSMLEVIPGIRGNIQHFNAALAVKTLSLLTDRYPKITAEKVQEGISSTRLPGRMETIELQLDDYDRPIQILLDGAHNSDGLIKLGRDVALRRADTKQKVVWVLAFSGWKDNLETYIEHLGLRGGDAVVCVSFAPLRGVRSIPSMEVYDAVQLARRNTEERCLIIDCGSDLKGALRLGAKEVAENNALMIVTGSLYLVGDVHRLLRDEPKYRWGYQSGGEQALDHLAM